MQPSDLFSNQPELIIQPLAHPLFDQKGLSVTVVRTDLIHPEVSGNKWYKLKYNLLQAKANNQTRLLSFGGAYSNHIHALAWAARQLGLVSVGIIRGEPVSNPMLDDAQRWGMQLSFVDRVQYRQRSDAAWLQKLMAEHEVDAVIPEGGSNSLALKGVGELMEVIAQQLPDLDYLLCACGTGGTLAGLLSKAPKRVQLEGYPVLKGGDFLYQEIESLLADANKSVECHWSLDLESHYGGYGKVKADHKMIWHQLEADFGMPLDPIYTAKLFRRFMEKVAQGDYPEGAKIALLHSGGLQGRRSLC